MADLSLYKNAQTLCEICKNESQTAIIATAGGVGPERSSTPPVDTSYLRTHINSRRLAKGILLSLVSPLTIAFLLDLSLGWGPLLTIGASIIFIPLASVIVIRATLSELERVIQEVAPIEPENQEN
jgi:hypothetical protein